MQWNKTDTFYIPPASGIGDAMQFTMLPAAFHAEFGDKMQLYFQDRFDLFAGNPHVIVHKSSLPKTVIDIWESKLPRKLGSPVYSHISRWASDKVLVQYKRNEKPKLYGIVPKRIAQRCITIQSEGSKRIQLGWTREIPLAIADVLVDLLKEKFKIIQVGGLDDYLISGVQDMRGGTVREMAAIIAGSDYFLSPNSGGMHIAAAFRGNPTVCMYSNQPVAHPVWKSDLTKYTAHDWLYNDTIYFGRPNLAGVLSIPQFVEYLTSPEPVKCQ